MSLKTMTCKTGDSVEAFDVALLFTLNRLKVVATAPYVLVGVVVALATPLSGVTNGVALLAGIGFTMSLWRALPSSSVRWFQQSLDGLSCAILRWSQHQQGQTVRRNNGVFK